MLSQAEFDNWCHRLNLSQEAQKTIEVIRSSEPSRRIGGGRKNVSGHYPSKKWGKPSSSSHITTEEKIAPVSTES